VAGDKKGVTPNGIKIGSNTLLYQGVTCFATRLREEWVRLGPAFDGAGLDAVQSVGIHHQRGQGLTRASGAEPSQGIDEADALEGHPLPLRRFEHDDAHQVVDQGKDRQFLHDPSQALAV